MLSEEERGKKLKIRDTGYFFQRLHDRGKRLFGNLSYPEMAQECFKAIKDKNKSAIVKDKRDTDSSHHCIFLSDSGGQVCLPLVVTEEEIIIKTIKDIKIADHPFWYVREYNAIATKRDLPRMNFIVNG